ncbi:MAG: ketol-acid reductoisomerase [Candidatus Marinimicrobia bacterium]|nr:ketol-acid reductoisomerase [Candidatus Neomarinimicrobiota bacterium]
MGIEDGLKVKLFTDQDASLNLILTKNVGVIGYGNQGRAQALNLKDSGVNVRIGLRDNSSSRIKVESDDISHGSIPEVTTWADVIVILIPDDQMKETYHRWIEPNLRQDSTLIFSHGYAVHYDLIHPDPQTTVLLCAPSGPGKLLRDRFVAGSGLPGLIAVHQDTLNLGMELILSYSKAIGITRISAVLSSFKEETETDLFGEQVILTGGLPHLIRSAFHTLVDAGYQPVVAWLVCFYEVKMIVDLFSSTGLEEMKSFISNTAEYGGDTRGKRLISNSMKQEMDKILKEIHDGDFFNEYTNTPMKKPGTKDESPRDEISDSFDQITRQILPLLSKNEEKS